MKVKTLRSPVEASKFRVLDLFAGCGGLSLGFKRVGFEICGSIEADPVAADSHARNFFRDTDRISEHACAIDITQTDPSDFLALHSLISRKPNVVIGGPPCQSFARVGRAKLREVYDHPQAFQLDPRKDLYLRFLAYVIEIKPDIVLMENVPDVMNSAGHNVC
jgi:DNA (cytosine-5)-methyltransferase 1